MATSDLTKSKNALGDVSHSGDNVQDSQWIRTEPLITPFILRTEYLFGFPLVSNIIDPILKKPQVMTDDLISKIINRSVTLAESEAMIDIFPTERIEKHPWDRNLYEQFGYFKSEHRPIFALNKLSITPSNNVDVYVVPSAWIEPNGFPWGQINIVPLTIAFQGGGFIPSQTSGGAAFLAILGQRAWIPAYWQLDYITGFPEGQLPKIVNYYIGIIASMEILSMIAGTYAKSTSRSIGIDGISQSVSTPGPQIFVQRMTELKETREWVCSKIKKIFHQKLIASNV